MHAKRPKSEEILVCSVEVMTAFLGVIAKSTESGTDTAPNLSFQKSMITSVFKKEISSLKAEVNNSIVDTKR